MAGDIVLLREETSRKKWPMCRVTLIQKDNDGFIQIVNIVVGTNASKAFGTQTLERLANKLALIIESKEENNSEQWNRTQDEISRVEECIDGKIYEWKH